MFMFDPHYMLQFPTPQSAVLPNPVPVSIYGLFSATVIVVCLLRSPSESTPDQRHFFSLAVLHARAANLHQLIGATFDLFGFIFFPTSPFVFIPLASSSTPGWMFIRNLSFYFAFAANVFFALPSSDGLRALSALRLNT